MLISIELPETLIPRAKTAYLYRMDREEELTDEEIKEAIEEEFKGLVRHRISEYETEKAKEEALESIETVEI